MTEDLADLGGCRARGGHRWPDLASFCSDCGTAWVDHVVAERARGDVVTRDEAGLERTTRIDHMPVAVLGNGVYFDPGMLDDPQEVARQVVTLKQSMPGSERLTWERPIVGRSTSEDLAIEGAPPGTRAPVYVDRLVAFGHLRGSAAAVEAAEAGLLDDRT